MAAPPNPGGNNRALMRRALANWLTAQRIQGLDKVYRSEPPEAALERYRTGGAQYSCQAWVILPSDDETQYVLVGPSSPTGKKIHYEAALEVWHRSYEPGELDWADDEDDYDRIYEAVKDCLRAGGRQLGRPDAIFEAGQFQGIRGEHERPMPTEGGAVDRSGVVRFVITQVI